ncbi:MAG TPA: hypothetical protein VNJ29_00855 [Candidatus Nitrosotenuis sp.]|nr:hypothetical protein [Candidatus Nitrosotenuis sp.]
MILYFVNILSLVLIFLWSSPGCGMTSSDDDHLILSLESITKPSDSLLPQPHQEKLILNIKQHLEEIHQKYGKVWLVSYASLFTQTERYRFHDPKWVFWNIRLLPCDDVYQHKRVGFLGDASRPQNWEKLATLFPNCFDMITDDWCGDLYYNTSSTDLLSIFQAMTILLKIGGEIRLPMPALLKIGKDKNDKFIILGQNDSLISFIEKHFDIKHSKDPSACVPLLSGHGGVTKFERLVKYVSPLEFPTPSICLELVKELPKLHDRDRIAFFQKHAQKINSAEQEAVEIIAKLAKNWVPAPPEVFPDNFFMRQYDNPEEAYCHTFGTFILTKK